MAADTVIDLGGGKALKIEASPAGPKLSLLMFGAQLAGLLVSEEKIAETTAALWRAHVESLTIHSRNRGCSPEITLAVKARGWQALTDHMERAWQEVSHNG